MLLAVRHTSTYRFEPPMRGVVQSLRLWPSRFEGQRIIDWQIEIAGASRGAAFRDGAGDRIETATLLGPVGKVNVQVSGTIDTTDLAGVLKGHRERVNPLAYLSTTPFTHADNDIRSLAEDAVAGRTDPLDRAHGLMGAVGAAVAYVPGETEQHTTAAEALTEGRGVCQDHAHVLIAAARALDMPARYVVGYLHAEGGIAEASHAWAEIHVGELGWVGFDASNGVCPDERYIRIGSGADAQDAAPIRGVSQGLGTEALEIDVSVAEASQ